MRGESLHEVPVSKVPTTQVSVPEVFDEVPEVPVPSATPSVDHKLIQVQDTLKCTSRGRVIKVPLKLTL